jgi:hypothetical protein
LIFEIAESNLRTNDVELANTAARNRTTKLIEDINAVDAEGMAEIIQISFRSEIFPGKDTSTFSVGPYLRSRRDVSQGAQRSRRATYVLKRRTQPMIPGRSMSSVLRLRSKSLRRARLEV